MSDLETEPKPSRRLWVFAAVGALALHLGCGALAIAHLREAEADDALGANAIEVGIEFASLRREATDLPPGPDADASVASPALADQKAEVKETELPKDTPTEPDEADRVVTPNESNKPREDDTKIAAVQTPGIHRVGRLRSHGDAEFRSDPGRTAFGRARDRQRRDRAADARDLAEGAGRPSRQAQALSGGALAEERRDHGRFALDRMGHVLSASIVKGSGDAAFDEAALAMVRRSDPVPQPPPLVADEGLNFTLPVIFRVKGKS